MASGRIEPSWRYRIYAFPIVLSQIYYGRPYDYVGYKKLEVAFEPEKASIDELATRLKSVQHVESDGLFYILADDKGSVDFVRLAFLLYGIRTPALYYMYFTVLFVSCFCFVISYFKDRGKLALLVSWCLALLLTMPVFVAVPPGISILDLHAFGILSLIPMLHIVLAATDLNPIRPAQLFPTLVQVFIITFVYHARASSISHTILLIAYPVLVYWSWPSESTSTSFRRRLAMASKRFAPLALLLIAMASLPVYQKYTYNPGYFGERATLRHIVYHTLLVGMQMNPVLRERSGLGEGDLGAANAVDTFLYERGQHRIPELRHWAANGLNTVTTQLEFDWVKYEQAAKDLYLTIWRQQLMQSLLTYVYYHPLDIANVFSFYTFQRYAYNPFRPVFLFVLVLTATLCRPRGLVFSPSYMLIALLMLAATLVVPFVFYAGGFIIVAETFVATGFVIYTTLEFLLSRIVNQMAGSMTSSVAHEDLSDTDTRTAAAQRALAD